MAESSQRTVGKTPRDSDSVRFWYVVDLLLLCVGPVALLAVFSVPIAVREELVFRIASPRVVTAYTSHYIHLTESHLVGNLVSYVVVAPTAYVLCLQSHRRWLFRKALLTFLLVFPFALSAMQLAFDRHRQLYGFSSINAALFGLLCFAVVSYTSTHLSSTVDETDAPALLFFIMAIITVLSVPSRAWMGEIVVLSVGIGLAYVVTLLSYIGIPEWDEVVDGWSGGRIEVGLLGLGVLLLFPFFGFNQQFTGDGAVFDLYTHLLGFCLAFIVVYVTAVILE
ncbi:hypothetical protein ACFQJ7_04140 [Halovenus rubra]|uniref:Uncharacterized protein n=2 Tax=Halovenus rubra TaxID=869890 RepID=A0ACC7DYD4_9EURY|nr:hypothetical protein [Halovenus rubra]